MRLPSCDYRRPVESEPIVLRCAHPRTITPGDVVTPEICRICACRGSGDKPKRLAAPHPPRLPHHGARRPSWRPTSVALVIHCADAGRDLGQAIESVLEQSAPPSDVLVVDEASTDDTPSVAARYAERGVRYVRVEHRDRRLARRDGWLATRGDILCFLDARDALAADYLARGLGEFIAANVGLVYSDVEFLGEPGQRTDYPGVCDRGLLARNDYFHPGCLVLREALAASRAFDVADNGRGGAWDWLLWRRVLADGWQARKQSGFYRLRHGANSPMSPWEERELSHGYYERASLARETITLFVPLAGRADLWQRFAQFLDHQTWPRDQTRLVLFDTSQNDAFSRQVRERLAACDYADARHIRAAVGEPGLADRPRGAAVGEVTLAMTRIYNRLAREAATDYVWIVEDDVLPPLDACERLLRAFDERTASVSGVYPSRFKNGYVVWQANQQKYLVRGQGVQSVGGNGFGCVVLRGDVLRETVFTATIDYPAYDYAFYHRLAATGLIAKIDWSVDCDHRV